MAKTGYKIVVYLDDNPQSPTYMQTYEERVLDETSCPISEDDLVLISNECEVSATGYTGYRLEIYYNRTTGEYVENRVLDSECEASSTEEQWVNSGSPYCETTEKGINTGYMIQLQVQMNPNIASYGETRTQRYKSPECGGNNCAIWEDIQKQCHIEVTNCMTTFDGTADISQIDSNPLSDTYNHTRTINKQDSDCENCTETTFSWLEVGTMCGDDELLCRNGIQQVSTNSYTVTQKYKTIGNRTIPMDEYQVVLHIEDDENCGYIRPLYEMRKIDGEYICDFETYTKYEKWCQYVSYDSGVTWSLSVPEVCERGDVIAYDSYDCGKPMYRWVATGEFMCEDNGDDGKLKIWNNEGKLSAYTPCDESNVLSGSETTIASTKELYSEYTNTMQVGDCVSVVNGLSVNNSYKLWLGDYTEEINGGLGSYERKSLDIPSRVNYFNGDFPSSTSHWNPSLRTMVLHPLTPPTLSGTTSMPIPMNNPQSYKDAAIFVPYDAYDDYLEDWSTYSNIIKQMNNDTVPHKAIIGYESDFTSWRCYVPDGESASTIGQNEWIYGRPNITSITLTNKVITVADNAFYKADSYSGMYNLKELNLGQSVRNIGNYAFKAGSSNVFNTEVSSLVIPSSVRTIGNYAFYGYPLTSLTINNGVETIGNSVFSDHWLTAITIPDSVQTIGSDAFKTSHTRPYDAEGCQCKGSLITRIEIGSGCTSIGTNAFYGSATNHGWSLDTVIVKALTPPTIPNPHWSASNIFSDNYVGSNNESEHYPYGHFTIYVPCQAYEDYIHDNNWSYFNRGNCNITAIFNTTRWVDSGTACVDGNIYVRQIEQGACDTEITTATTWYNTGNQRTTGSPIGWCGKVLSYFSDGNRYSAACDDNTTVSSPYPYGEYDRSKLVSSIVGDCIEVIGDDCYDNYENLSAVTIGDNVNTIGQSAFIACISLRNIVLPSSVRTIGKWAFRGCSGLTTISCFAPYPPTVGNYAFSGLTSLERIYVPCESLDAYKSASVWSGYADIIRGFTEERQWISGTVRVVCDLYEAEIEQSRCDSSEPWVDTGNYRTIGEPIDFCCKVYMEYDEDSGGKYGLPCDGNTTLSNSDTHINKTIRYIKVGDCITHIGDGAFLNFRYVSGITIPDTIVSIGNSAFDNCRNLDGEFIIPSGVTSISNGLFYECSSLDSIVIHSGVTSIGDYAFYGCSSLTSCTIGSGVTSIGFGALSQCQSLTSITIQSGVTSIGNYAFNGCHSLTSITINPATPPTIDGNDYASVFKSTNNCPIYVPAESLDAYKTAWSTLADRITSI